MFKVGNKLKITGFSDQCPKTYQHKLMSMGFIRGEVIEIRNIAPMGDPIQIEIQGYSLSLRQSELSLIDGDLL